ncbi:MAG TPA: DUF1329 domain-containing protein [Candidatus Binataceae bacterium]|nr:DUF1329 domain-containing protein [Candidatus Binataceae bacterium]
MRSSAQSTAPYRDATEKYADQVRLSPNWRTMVNYVAGQPFPFLDPNDPRTATRIMWDSQFRPITSDGYDLRYYDCNTVRSGLNNPVRVLDYFHIGHHGGYDEGGRTEVDPIQIDPDYKKTNRYWLFGLYLILAPFDLSGTGLTTFDPDHYSGFSAKVEEYNYKCLGQKTMLASVNAFHSPEITCQTDGGSTACPEGSALDQQYLLADLSRSPGARRPCRNISVQARFRRGRIFDRRAIRGHHDVLPSGAGHAGARMLVHQHGCGGSQFLHPDGNGVGGSRIISSACN